MVATKDYVTRESTLLSFRRGDIIKLVETEMILDTGKSSVFSVTAVRISGKNDYKTVNTHRLYVPKKK